MTFLYIILIVLLSLACSILIGLVAGIAAGTLVSAVLLTPMEKRVDAKLKEFT